MKTNEKKTTVLEAMTLPSYWNRTLKAGDKFDAEDEHVDLLVRSGLAKRPEVEAKPAATIATTSLSGTEGAGTTAPPGEGDPKSDPAEESHEGGGGENAPPADPPQTPPVAPATRATAPRSTGSRSRRGSHADAATSSTRVGS